MRRTIRHELASLFASRKDKVIKRWARRIFTVPGHRRLRHIIPRGTHIKGMSQFFDAFVSDIAHIGQHKCEEVISKLVFKDYLSASRAEDVVHGQIILRTVLNNILLKIYAKDLKRLKDASNILISEIGKNVLCISRLYKRRDFNRLRTIMRYGKKLISIHELNKVCHLILEAAVKESGADRASIMLMESDGYLRIKSAIDIPRKIISTTRVRPGEGIAGRVLKKSAPIIINKGQKIPPAIKKDLLGLGIYSAVSIPVITDGQAIGVLNLGKYRGKQFFDEEDVELLVILAYEAGAAINNCRLYEEVHDLYTGSIISLAAAIDARDHYTHGHSSKVARLATATARRLRLSPDDLDKVYLASMLHDIGKIGIPDKILLKPGRLTKKEFDIVKRHPIHGVRILKHIPRMKAIIPIIYHEHERYDGKGYVKGLRGQEIPLESRIIAIADAYEAMTSDRPYRKALSKKEAIRELKRCAGTQFDPKLVNIFLGVVKK